MWLNIKLACIIFVPVLYFFSGCEERAGGSYGQAGVGRRRTDARRHGVSQTKILYSHLRDFPEDLWPFGEIKVSLSGEKKLPQLRDFGKSYTSSLEGGRRGSFPPPIGLLGNGKRDGNPLLLSPPLPFPIHPPASDFPPFRLCYAMGSRNWTVSSGWRFAEVFICLTFRLFFVLSMYSWHRWRS